MHRLLAALLLLSTACGARTPLPDPGEAPDAGSPDGPPTPMVRCVAPSGETVVLAPNQNPSGFAMDEAYLYWLDQNSQQVRRISKLGGTPQTVAAVSINYASFMAVDDGDVYWTTGHELLRVPKTGGAPELVTTDRRTDDANGIALDALNMYWGSIVHTSIFQRAKAGGPTITLATGQSQPAALAVDSSFVYWVNGLLSNDTGLDRVPIGGGGIVSLAATRHGSHVVLDEAHVYWTEQEIGSGFVARVSKDGTGLLMLASAQAPAGIAVDDSYVWLTDSSADIVSRTSKAGGVTTAIAMSQSGVAEVATDAACVYWTTKSADGVVGSVVAYGK